jgi:exodeoxyribonuclease X
MNKFYVIDSETTGKTEPEVIELGWVESNLESFEIMGRFNGRFKPNKPIELGAIATHNILLEDLETCPNTKEAILSLPRGIEYWVGHNCDYDYKVLGSPPNIKLIDTLGISRKLFPDLDSHTQSAMMYYFEGAKAKDKLLNSHSALIDCRNCLDLLKHLVSFINNETKTLESLEDLYNLSQECRLFDTMPFGKHKGVSLDKIPFDYLSWLFKQPDLDPWLIESFKRIGRWR